MFHIWSCYSCGEIIGGEPRISLETDGVEFFALTGLARAIDGAYHRTANPIAVSTSPATGTGHRIRLSVTACASGQPGACAWHRQCAPHGAAVTPTNNATSGTGNCCCCVIRHTDCAKADGAFVLPWTARKRLV